MTNGNVAKNVGFGLNYRLQDRYFSQPFLKLVRSTCVTLIGAKKFPKKEGQDEVATVDRQPAAESDEGQKKSPFGKERAFL